MLWSDIFKLNKKCTHPNVALDADIAYCPDCGELVENRWYITRCACCGVKTRATVSNGEVIPEENFCHNCGSRSYVVERLEKIDCININYAIVVREVIQNETLEYTQSWQEVMKTTDCTPKLLQQFR